MANPNELQFAPLPDQAQPQSELPQWLATLTGLAANVVGAVTQTGALGNQSVSLAEQLRQEAERRNGLAAKYKASQEAGQAVWNRAQKDIADPGAREMIRTQVQNLDDGGALSSYNTEVSRQRQAKSESRADSRDAFMTAEQLRLLAESQAKELKSTIPRAAEKASMEQDFFKAQTAPFKDAADLQQRWKGTYKGSNLNGDEAKALYDTWKAHLTSKQDWSQYLGQSLGYGSNNQPAHAFDDYAASRVKPEELQAYAEHKGLADSAAEKAQALRELQARLRNPGTAPQAKRELDALMGAGAAPAAGGLSPKDAKRLEQLRAKKAAGTLKGNK